MTIKNHIIKAFRISEEMFEQIKEASDKLDFKQTDIIRFLLNRSLMQLKSESIKAGGYDKMSFSIKETLPKR